MRLIVWLTIVFFAAILILAYVYAKKAHPQFIDVDPAAVHQLAHDHGH